MAEPDLGERIEELAALQFSDREIALIVQLEPEALIAEYGKRVDRGRLLAEAEVRRAVLQMAKQGSTPAQKQFAEYNSRAKATRLTRAK